MWQLQTVPPSLDRDLSYGEILACEENILYMHAITKVKKGT